MSRDYSHVSTYTHTFIAEQRDMLDEQEMRAARAADAAEPATDRAWRVILIGHDHIRAQIGEIRRALHDMGCGLTSRGILYTRELHVEGYRWHDPRPDVTLNTAQKRLHNCLADMPRRWAALQESEKIALSQPEPKESRHAV